MTLIKTMLLIGLFGLTMHLQLYWIAGFVAAALVIGTWMSKRSKRAVAKAYAGAKTD
jgi:hypothetical protein